MFYDVYFELAYTGTDSLLAMVVPILKSSNVRKALLSIFRLMYYVTGQSPSSKKKRNPFPL